MTRILHISTSPRSDRSLSRQLGGELLARLSAVHAGAELAIRDLVSEPLPHLGDATVAAMFTPPDARDASLEAAIARSDALVDELIAADVIVLDTPMFNWSLPSALKAWIDHVVRPGRTFMPGPQYQPMLKDRPTYIVIASGGIYERAGRAHHDFLTPYLQHVLGWMGLKDLRFVRAEGVLASSDEAIRSGREELSTATIDAGSKAVAA